MSAFIKVTVICSCRNLSIQAKPTFVNHRLIQVVGTDAEMGVTSITLTDGNNILVSETKEEVLSLIHASTIEQLKKAAARRKEMR